MGEFDDSSVDTEFSTGAIEDASAEDASADPTDNALAGVDDASLPGEDGLSFGFSPEDATGVGSSLASYLNVGGPKGVTAGSGNAAGVPLIARATGRDKVFGVAGRSRLKAILQTIWNKVGKKIALHVIVALIDKWGLAVAASAFGVGADDLTFLIAENAVARRGRGKRGPHLHTIVKRIRRGRHYEHLLRRWSSKAGVHRHHTGGAKRRKRKR